MKEKNYEIHADINTLKR